MSVYIDKKYISLLAPKLKQFRTRGEFLWNFRCPACGDSQKNEHKARGYIYKRGDRFRFICHNCGSPMSLDKFIRFVDTPLYNEYQLESFQDKVSTRTSTSDKKIHIPEGFMKAPVFAEKALELTDSLVELTDLPENFYARQYMAKRKIPLLKGIYYTSDFAEYIKEQFPDVDKPLRKEEPRIIIPFYDREGSLIGVQGRSIGPSKLKYITIKANDDVQKIFGWDKVDLTKTIYVVEGPLDSLFLYNGVATMDAALYHTASILGLDLDYIFVYDNERRNTQIVSNMRKTVALGRKVCIWPDEITEKDINEMVLAGRSPTEIKHIIDRNSYDGLMATMKINQWEKT
jgi:transcription elongation factor Elf1